MKQLMPRQLGVVNEGDIIAGRIYDKKLKVIKRRDVCDDIKEYLCEYIEGINKGDIVTVMSYYEYRKVI